MASTRSTPSVVVAITLPQMLWCAALTATLVLCWGVWLHRQPDVKRAPMSALQGAAATAYLKEQGAYDSLAAAVSAARYQIKAAPSTQAAPYSAHNPSQQLGAAFTPEEVRVDVAEAEMEGTELRL